ncbi:periplasmic chaperone for outer membrane proteins Skp [Flavobacterium akiainvivens]|nr:periplasmic chaperone for outer membrane proteins Skp [Flavobacterium akiainvivens]
MAAAALVMFSCNKEEGKTAASAGFKTAYVDIQKISEDYEEFKDLESKLKIKQEELGRGLAQKAQQWKLDYAEAQQLSASKGPQWSQLKGQELQKREQDIAAEQQTLGKQMQDEVLAQNDSVSKKIKKHIEAYGKKNGYDYIYSTSDVSSIIYAKDGYNITDQILKELNDNYKSTRPAEPAKEEKKK